MAAAKNVSALLGQKLLAGWTMLADSCPQTATCTGVPLMRDPTGKMHCVSCGRNYVKDTDVNADNTFRTGNQDPSSAATPVALEAPAAAPTTATPASGAGAGAQPTRLFSSGSSGGWDAAAAAASEVERSGSAVNDMNVGANGDDALNHIERALLGKLDDLATALAAASAPREIHYIAKATEGVSRALAAVRGVPRR